MGARSLYVLMWKHGMVRVRRFIHTAVDFGAPVVFFVLLYTFKDVVNPVPLGNQQFYKGVHETDTIQLKDAGTELRRVLYWPESPASAQLMEAVGKQLNLQKVTADEIHDVGNGKRYYQGVSNKSLLTTMMEPYSSSEAVVIFQDMEGDELPKKLNYTIRMNEPNFQTGSYLPQDVLLGAHNQFGQMYETFMRLQWAIDTSFIMAHSPDFELPQDVSLQEFPYYQSYRRTQMEIVCYIVESLCWLSLLLTFTFLMSRLLEERASGIQELIKMVGVSVHTLGVSHFLNVLPVGIVYAVVATTLLKVSANPLVPNTDGILIFMVLLLHFVSVVAMAFACSHLSNSTQYVTSISVLSYMALYMPLRVLVDHAGVPRMLLPLVGLLPHVPLYWFWTEVQTMESFDGGVTASTMWTHHSTSTLSGAACAALLCAQALLFFLLAWYLSLVRPGRYGQSRPWNFFCQRQYWSRNEVKPQMDGEEEEEFIGKRDRAYFEPLPGGAELGIRVANVTKAYGKEVVLKNVSLEVLKGEITVLLGHNGAGKTTLMSIITGMTGVTEGKVYVNGMDTETELSSVRQHLGLCPQHNLFFPDLTVLEHVMFFTMLKKGTYTEAKKSSMELVEQLGLGGKARVRCHELSGGMKRRAQLACALAGGADLLVLDEPTSGLDVESRRQLWDLLLSLRGSRTVLLTTHFMEEADALGDRVAALHDGRLRCFATTMHLKKAIGTGYRLSLTTTSAPKEEQISEEVTLHVPSAAVIKEKTTSNTISYNLPAADSHQFPKLFTSLEARRNDLGIDSIGVGVSTLEEVFLKLCSDSPMRDDDDIDTSGIDSNFIKQYGPLLLIQQLCILIKRQILYIRHRITSFVIMQAILPILIICLMTNTCNTKDLPDDEHNTPLALDMGVYRGMADKRVIYNTPSPALRTIADYYPDVHFEKADNITETILDIGMKDIHMYNKYIDGIELNDTNAKMLFTTTVRHAAPVAMNMLSNLLAAQSMPAAAAAAADGHVITTINHPLTDYVPATDLMVQPKSVSATIMWAMFIPFIFLATMINLVSLPCKERETGARHIHIMCGCPATLHWAATLLAHTAVSTLCLILPVLLAAFAFDRDSTINNVQFLGVLALILMAGSLSFCASMYLVSFHFGERSASIVLFAAVIVFGMVTPPMEAVTKFVGATSGAVYHIGVVSSWLAPPHALAAAVARAAQAARDNAFCDLNRDKCPNIISMDTTFDVDKCCAGEQPRCYLCMDKLLINILVMFLQFLVYMVMVILTQRGVFSYLCDRLWNISYKPVLQPDASDMVRTETKYVAHAIEQCKNQIPDAMLVNDVHKRYPGILSKSVNAVQGVSFSVKKGECFGLLGVNGAGKSTTFKMLTAELFPTRGKIYANDQHLGVNNSKYLQTLGYCPQFFGLDDFLTGRDNLSLLLALRGFRPDDMREEVKTWINIVGLEKYAGRAVSGYSGGCVRRLGAAAALCVGGRVTLLDEPTAGVDVSARRRVWAALRKGLRNKRSVLITSHSMDEMEALCSRIAILSGGRTRALGSAAQLRAHHAAGHAVVFKIRHARPTHPTRPGDVVDGENSQTKNLKSKLLETFNCSRKDEHKTMLHYHINETMKYSELFEKLEALKQQFPNLIEDYSVTETTLEEVFLSFARPPGCNTFEHSTLSTPKHIV